MADSIASSDAAPRTRFRFSLRGMLVFMLGIAMALAAWRLPRITLPTVVLTALVPWFTLGMIQRARQAWRSAGLALCQPEICGGLRIEAALMLGTALLPIIALLPLVVASWRGAQYEELEVSLARTKLTDILFFLALIAAYLSSAASWSSEDAFRRFKTPLLRVFGALVGVYWLLLVLVDSTLIVSLVYMAIRGVHSAQPLRIAGHDIAPPNLHLELNRQFLFRGIAAGVLLLAAFGALLRLPQSWSRGRWTSTANVLAVCGALVAAAALVAWSLTVAFPTLAPNLAPTPRNQSPGNLAAGIVLVIVAATALAWRLSLETVTDATRSAELSASQSTVPPHERLTFLIVLLVVLLWQTLYHWKVEAYWSGMLPWSLPGFWSQVQAVAQYQFLHPGALASLAAIIVVAQRIWLRRKPVTPPEGQQVLLNPWRFAAIWPLALGIVLLAGPVGFWLALALFINDTMPW
jgi:hypothetical protein